MDTRGTKENLITQRAAQRRAREYVDRQRAQRHTESTQTCGASRAMVDNNEDMNTFMRSGLDVRRGSDGVWSRKALLAGVAWIVIATGIAQGQVGQANVATPGKSGTATGKVSYERILGAAREPSNWLTYSGRYSGWRYSTLDQINVENVSRLRMEWTFQVGDLGQFETTPLVVDGILYGTGQNNRAFALDARTGRAIWRYQRNLPAKLQPCCGAVNRGFAMLGDRLFMHIVKDVRHEVVGRDQRFRLIRVRCSFFRVGGGGGRFARLFNHEMSDGLGFLVIEELEVLFLQIAECAALRVPHDHAHEHFVHLHAKGSDFVMSALAKFTIITSKVPSSTALTTACAIPAALISGFRS